MPSLDLLQGTLDLLVLKVVARGPIHGWGIAQRILETSSRQLVVNQGSLYPALHRLEDRGLVRASWGQSENNRRARYYEITAAGRRQLEAERESWRRFTGAVQAVLELA